jgi:hypothetical protein
MKGPFKLDQAIAKWRKEMTAQGVRSRDVLDELENHLREDIAAQIQSGTSEVEAFDIAVQRIGRGAALHREFAKLDASKHKRLSKLFRISCFVTGPFMLVLSGWLLYDPDRRSFDRPVSLFLLTCLAIYTGTLPVWYRLLPSPHTKWRCILLKTITFMVAALPLVALAGALGLPVPRLGNTGSLVLWSVVTAYTATMSAYACLDLERGVGWRSQRGPSSEQFTELAQRARSGLAHEEAERLGHDYVGTEHLLLGVISCDSGLLSDLLRKWGIEADAIRAEIEKVAGPGVARKSARDLPYTPRATRALTLALQETCAMGQSFITPEHIMLGLLLEKEGLAGVVLRGLGIDADRARRDILDGMGPSDGEDGLQPVLA